MRIAALLLLVLAVAGCSPATAGAPAPVIIGGPTVPATTATTPTADIDPADPPGVPAKVARVIDGDTFELATGETVRVLGINSCEASGKNKTPGGAKATAWAQEVLMRDSGGQVVLVTEPGVDRDRYGRLLRYVLLADGSDFGVSMVKWDHTGIYTESDGGHGDASDAYLDELYAHDRDYSAVPPPSGRECGEEPKPEPQAERDDDTAYVPVPSDDDDDHGESRFCRKRWWC